MSTSFHVRLVLSVLIPLALSQPGQAAPTTEEISRAVEQLGSDNFRLRQKASAFLWAAGKAAEPALLRALKSKDQEVVRRAREILDKFKYGIYPNTPRNVVDLIARYRSGTEDTKRSVMRDLSKLGSPGHAVLIKLAAQEKDGYFRRELFTMLAGDVVPGLLADSHYDDVEELLELGLQGGDDQAIRNYAAFLALRGQVDARIPKWTRKAKKLTGYRDAEVLAYLYRARGDLKNACLAARKAEKKPLLASLLIEQSDWKELAANPELVPFETADPLDQLAHSAAYHRLAGNTQEFVKAIAAVLDFGIKNPLYGRKAANVLLLNDRSSEAIDLLRKTFQLSFAFELLAAQQRYREAFDLADKVKPDHEANDLYLLRSALARTHATLGDLDQAAKVLDKLFDDTQDPRQRYRRLGVIETEYKLNLKDQAFAHAAKVMAQAEKANELPTLFGYLFPEQDSQALVWWKFFRQKYAAEQPAASLKRVRTVFDRKVPAREFDALVKQMEEAAPEPRLKKKAEGRDQTEDRPQWFLALAETCLTYGRQKLAQGYLEKAGSAEALTRLGDLLADNKLWLQAAERYGQAWTKNRSRAEALYLRGWCLQQAGLKQEGQKWMDLAHLIPLANDRVRFKLSQTLARHGLARAADRERDLILRTGRMNYAEVSNSLRSLALAAYARKDYQLAADCHERTMLVCLGNVYFIRASAYLTVPAVTHDIRARGLVARGKLAEALKEVQLSLAGFPGDIESAIHLVPELEKHNHKKEADQLFNQLFEHYTRVCKAYPKSAQHHNTIAWLAVCCRRHLDRALAHAKQAVALTPKGAGYLDTLAEVYYQRGDKAEAIKLMKKCIELDPKSDYYRKQVKRFEAKGPPSATPTTN